MALVVGSGWNLEVVAGIVLWAKSVGAYIARGGGVIALAHTLAYCGEATEKW